MGCSSAHLGGESTRRRSATSRKWAREYACIFQESTEESLYPVTLIDRARRTVPGDIPPERDVAYTAAIDPSLGRNAWTLVIAGRRQVDDRIKSSIVVSREWRAPVGQHFDMAAMLIEIAGIVAPYTREILTDQFHGESLEAISNRMELGVSVVVDKPTAAERLERYESLLTRLSDDEIELPHDPQLRADLVAVKRKFTQSGFVIHLPTTGDGRHADFAPAVTLAFGKTREDEAPWLTAMKAIERRGGQLWGPPAPARREWRDVRLGAPADESAPVRITRVQGRTDAYSNAPQFRGMTATKFGDGRWSFSAGSSNDFKTAVQAAEETHAP